MFVFYLFIPSKLYFFPVLNTVTPTVILLFAVVWQRWARSGNPKYAAAMGAVLYLLVFFEPLPLVMGLLFLILMIWLRWPPMTVRRSMMHLAIAVSVAVALDALMYAVFRFEVMRSFLWQLGDAVDFNRRATRPYHIWVTRDLVDFAFGTGMVQIMCFLTAIGMAVWSWRKQVPIAAFSAALAIVILTTDVLGVNRGEVVRLWIFLGCFSQIPAAYACARLNSRAAVAIVLLTSVLQGALGTVMMGFATP
jgi:hypothetical protein